MSDIDWDENDHVVLQRRIEKLEREVREAADGRGARWRRRVETRMDAIVATFEPPLTDARVRIAALERATPAYVPRTDPRHPEFTGGGSTSERATPAREDRRPQLAWWVGEVERLKDCVTRAERELAEAGRQVDHVMRSISRVERERDEARERADEGIEMAHAGTRNAIAERDAARASAEKYREALGRIANGADVMYSTEVRVIAWRALDGGDS